MLCCLYTEEKVNILEIIFPCWPFGRRTETNFIRAETEFGKNIFVWYDRHHPLGHTPTPSSSPTSSHLWVWPASAASLNWLVRSEDRKFSFVNKHRCRRGIKLSQCCSSVLESSPPSLSNKSNKPDFIRKKELSGWWWWFFKSLQFRNDLSSYFINKTEFWY